MKLLFIIDNLRADGTQHVLGQLVAGLTAHGHRVAVLCLNDAWDETVLGALRQTGAEVRIVGKLALVGGYGLLGALSWMRREQFTVAVTMLFASDVLGRALARAAKVPRIVTSLRARNIHYQPWQLLLVRATMPWAAAVIVNSPATRSFAVGAEGACPDRLVYIPNGVAVEAYTQPYGRAELHALFGVPEAHALIGNVGRLTAQKGQDGLLHALAKLDQQQVDLLLIGEGEDAPMLRERAKQLGLAQRVHFAGYRRDVPQILGALDLYAHPARFEGMPNALLEAMAAGCPIVATDVDGNRELIEDGEHGWLVPVDAVTTLAATLAAALANPNEARRRGVAAQQRARANFSVTAMVAAWERVVA